MADKTKADLEEELRVVRHHLDEANKENQLMKEAGGMDLTTWHSRIKDQEAEIERLKQEVKLRDERMNEWKLEQKAKEQDAKAKHERETRPYQTEHTRFRLLPGPYLRDIFGNVGVPVFDLGVTLDHYSGHVDIPLDVVVEMAQSIGMLTADQADELNKQLETEKAKNEAAAQLGSILAGGIHNLVGDFHSSLDSVGIPANPQGHTDGTDSDESAESAGLDDSDAADADAGNDGDADNGVDPFAIDTDKLGI